MLMRQQQEIVSAIEQELRIAGQDRAFRVVSAAAQQDTIRISVRAESKGRLDHTLEGGVAQWSNSSSPVVAVDVENSQVYVHKVTGPLPVSGHELRIQPPRFLESLLECWKDQQYADECFSWAARALIGRERDPLALSPLVPGLRVRQCEAYALLGYRAGFLWGPPGTGKTTTAAAIVADLMTVDSTARVLLVAPTNSAVDQLLIAVDTRLSLSARGQSIRTDCARIGSNFLARYYEKRPHLLPEATDELLVEKARLEATQPSAEDVEGRARWMKEMERVLAALRSQVESILHQRRVVALTATLSSMCYGALRKSGRFNLIVFDEASQLGRAIALMLAPLAERALICGDPRQLAPIFSANSSSVRRWFGCTLFDEYMDARHPSTCFLNEQSRMAPPICGLVSELFYDGQLHVSQDSLVDDAWHRSRIPGWLPPSTDHHNLHCVPISTESTPHGSSHRRQESAEAAAAVVQQLATEIDPGRILILTPFVAQRRLIRATLNARGLRRARVSTVHAAQGAETHTIIFDPVKGNSQFLLDPNKGPRLLNVAMSRAQACFVVLVSAGDLKHPLLQRIVEYIRLTEGADILPSIGDRWAGQGHGLMSPSPRSPQVKRE